MNLYRANIENLIAFWTKGQHLLFVIGTALLIVAVGIVVEGIRAHLRRDFPLEPAAGPEVE